MMRKQTRKMQQPQISLAIKESQKRAFLLLSGGNNVAEHFYSFMLSTDHTAEVHQMWAIFHKGLHFFSQICMTTGCLRKR